MAKPIFIITTPEDPSLYNAVSQALSDYHVLVVNEPTTRGIDFRLFSDREIEPIKLEELKRILRLNNEQNKIW